MTDNLANTAVNTTSRYQAIVTQYAIDVSMRILDAVVFWVVGHQLISPAMRMVEGSSSRQKVDPTMLRYVDSIITITLNVLLVVGILGYFDIQTTMFTTLIVAADAAISIAWSSLLSNFATGTSLIVLRPSKVSDLMTAGGMTGAVKEIGLFATTINTPDNVANIISNSKIFADTIQNYTSNPSRRVELETQLIGNADYHTTVTLLKERVAAVPNVLIKPAVDVEILEFDLVGPVLAVCPYTRSDNYRQVYFDIDRAIREVPAEGDLPAPTPSQALTITMPGQLAELVAVAQGTTASTSVN